MPVWQTSEEWPRSLEQHSWTYTAPAAEKLKAKAEWTLKYFKSNRQFRVFDMQDGKCVILCLFYCPSTQSMYNSDNLPLSSSSRTVRERKELVTLENIAVLQGVCLGVMEQYDPTLMTSSSDDLHSTDSRRSVTVPSSSTEITLTGTATVFPVRMAVFRISASWETKKSLFS